MDITIGEEEYTKYERARLIGSRALQLSMGAPFLIKLTPKKLEELKFNPVNIAKEEFKEGVLPITIKRILPHQR
ncbi:MAG: DNA-directed RNA polymerase subunit K [Nanoarchaeota archaeon]|nr:DNA-directed RNA polymerase subunit K [Nanoarchaeota archaeon]MBU1029763.1 DNA-directed RNA polymerase subunit K [Nanoarchaeota archaeon]MBU1850770.1 DNA-directed RNA polymerase subunit K [Nanoarchaeota archaeon]